MWQAECTVRSMICSLIHLHCSPPLTNTMQPSLSQAFITASCESHRKETVLLDMLPRFGSFHLLKSAPSFFFQAIVPSYRTVFICSVILSAIHVSKSLSTSCSLFRCLSFYPSYFGGIIWHCWLQ